MNSKYKIKGWMSPSYFRWLLMRKFFSETNIFGGTKRLRTIPTTGKWARTRHAIKQDLFQGFHPHPCLSSPSLSVCGFQIANPPPEWHPQTGPRTKSAIKGGVIWTEGTLVTDNSAKGYRNDTNAVVFQCMIMQIKCTLALKNCRRDDHRGERRGKKSSCHRNFFLTSVSFHKNHHQNLRSTSKLGGTSIKVQKISLEWPRESMFSLSKSLILKWC